ncbi:MAG: HlyC/CorC family transporter, partial [Tissierellia bacterium]|nr:HlyC/CorC family transporter [Tissierellia bacterium]
LIVFIFLSAFFSSSETALISINKFKVRQLQEKKVKNADTLARLMEKPNAMISAILVGNNIVNIASSSLATSICVAMFGAKGVFIATVVMTIIILIFGEITPKTLAQENPEKMALKASKPIYILTIVFKPVLFIFNKITIMISKLFGRDSNSNQPSITEDEFMTIVDVGHEEGVIEGEEKEMIHNVFAFGDSLAEDVMTPRTSMVVVNVDEELGDLIKFLDNANYSRIPVFDENIDDIIGILYVRDLIAHLQDYNFSLRDHLRPAFFAYESKPIMDLFKEMQEKNVSMAIVADEYGGTSGLVTIEDLVEEIVGEIYDEYDEEVDGIKKVAPNEYLIDASTELEEINEELGLDLESDVFDSIGGFVIGIADKIPDTGDSYSYKNLEFFIVDAENTKINELKLKINPIKDDINN